MKQTNRDFLFRLDAPHVSLGVREPESSEWIPGVYYSRPGLDVYVRRLRGHKMRTTATLMDEFAAALQFFDGFGENWNAMEESLMDLDERLPSDSYVLLIDRAEELLIDEHDSVLESLLESIEHVGKSWSRPIVGHGQFDRGAKPFHLLMNLSSEDTSTERFDRVASSVSIRQLQLE